MSSKLKNDRKTMLRRKAEERLKKKYDYVIKKTSQEDSKITHELWVNQIELEMQNEELRKAQNELAQLHHKYVDLFDFSPIGYFVLNNSGIIIEVNLTGTSMVGIERKFLIQKAFDQCIAKEDKDKFYIIRNEALKSATGKRCELKMIRKNNGTEFIADVIIEPVIDDNNKIISSRVAIINITERKKVEDELSLSKQNLEMRVKEKTADLLEIVKILRGEIEQRKQTELALQKKTRDVDAFFSSSINPLVILDSNFKIVRLNQAFADAWEKKISDFEGRNYFEFCTNEENKRIFQEVVITKQPHQTTAMPFIFPDRREWGETYWDWNLVPVLDKAGNVDLLALSLKNVTENIKSQRALEEKEKKYRTLIEVSPDAICVAVTNKIVLANNAAVKILNIKNSKDLIGKSIWYFVHPDSLKIIKEKLERYRKDQTDTESVEISLIRTDGSLIEAEVTAVPVDYETQKAILIIFQDISLRKRQEITLKKIKYRLAEAQRIAHLGNWDWDIANNSLWLSDESYRIFGIEKEKFEGKYHGGLESLLKFIHPEDRQRVKQTIDDSVAKCKPYDIEHRIIRQDGVQRFVHKRAEIECIQEKAIRMVGTIQDITEQKKSEMQLLLSRQGLRTLAAKIELVEEQERRRIAGDLHDSVGQILAFATRELKFIRKSLPQTQADALLEISHQLDKAIEQTRSLSFDLSPSILYDIGFEIAVEDLVEKFSNERKINGRFENDKHAKPLTIPLKVLLYRSIRELLMNIAKHAKAKNVKVSIEKKENNIQVTVEDDGVGFDISEIDKSDKTKGFGLFNIRERIEHADGSFQVKSTKNKGTKTILTVPLSIHEKQ